MSTRIKRHFIKNYSLVVSGKRKVAINSADNMGRGKASTVEKTGVVLAIGHELVSKREISEYVGMSKKACHNILESNGVKN